MIDLQASQESDPHKGSQCYNGCGKHTQTGGCFSIYLEGEG